MKNRIAFVDMLKAMAIVGVVIIHVSGGLHSRFDIPSINWYLYVFCASLVRWSVPIFLMCSGVLFLNSDKTISIKQIFTKYLPRILAALIFWALMYELVDVIIEYRSTGILSFGMINNVIKNIVTCNTHFHFYYLYIIILIYCLVPIIRVFTNAADKKHMEYALFAWLALGVVFTFSIKFYPFNLLKGIVLQYGIRMAYACIGFFVLGYYFNKYKVTKRTTNIIYVLGIFGFAITIVGTIYLSKESLDGTFFEGMSPNVTAMAAALFLFIKNLAKKGNNKLINSKAIGYLSKASFCVYLVHDFFNIIFRLWGLDKMISNALVSISVLTLMNLMLSIGVYFVLSRIPYVNKYLI